MWWLWLLPALVALVIPVELFVSVATRGWEDVRSSGIAGGEIGLVYGSGIFTVLSFPVLLVVSPLYVFMFWRRRERGVPMSRRFWVPIYGSALLVVVWGYLVLSALSRTPT